MVKKRILEYDTTLIVDIHNLQSALNQRASEGWECLQVLQQMMEVKSQSNLFLGQQKQPAMAIAYIPVFKRYKEVEGCDIKH